MKNRILKYAPAIFMAAVLLTSCYDKYWDKDNEKQAVLFANAVDVRTVVIGEGMSFSTGAYLSGIIKNGQDRKVDYSIDESLVTSRNILSAYSSHTFPYIVNLAGRMTHGVTPMDRSLYKLAPEASTTIKKGSHLGEIRILVDSAAFLADATRFLPYNAIGLRLTGCNSVDLLEDHSTTVIGVHYENMLFGTWYHGGEALLTDSYGTELGSTTYHTAIPSRHDQCWTLTTEAPFSLSCNGIGTELASNKAQMHLALSPDGSGNIELTPDSGAEYRITQDGECRFNKAKRLQDRKIFLKYKYTIGAVVYHCSDTLTFRNRERDGINEWQDENPDNY